MGQAVEAICGSMVAIVFVLAMCTDFFDNLPLMFANRKCDRCDKGEE